MQIICCGSCELIDQARIKSSHEVLEIGCGWGSVALEIVRLTGCRYTGVTLSIEQLKFATARVKEAGLQVSKISSVFHYAIDSL